jgi:hypothetical protein
VWNQTHASLILVLDSRFKLADSIGKLSKSGSATAHGFTPSKSTKVPAKGVLQEPESIPYAAGHLNRAASSNTEAWDWQSG